jgi:hypothetical protein
MRFHLVLIVLLTCMAFAVGCGKTKTPENLINAYAELLSEVEALPLEEAIVKLEEFQRTNSNYSISNNIEDKLVELRAKLKEPCCCSIIEVIKPSADQTAPNVGGKRSTYFKRIGRKECASTPNNEFSFQLSGDSITYTNYGGCVPDIKCQ